MTLHRGPGWELAAVLIQCEREADELAPNRSKASDGSIGDQSHANRKSKHNSKPFVHALDLTHDPAGGFDAVVVADRIAQRCAAGLETRISGIGSYNWSTNSERWFACRDGVWSWIDQDLHGASHRTHMHLECNASGDRDGSPLHIAPQLIDPGDDGMPKLVQRKDPDGAGRRPIAVTDGIFRNDLGPTELAAVRTIWPTIGDPVVIASPAFDALVLNSTIGK